MAIRLIVRWPNAGSPMLENPTVEVLADGAPVAPASVETGRYLFEIEEGAAHVHLKVQFAPSFPTRAGVLGFVVLTADQGYRVEGTTLAPDPAPFALVNGDVIAQNVHPLIDTVGAGNASLGVTVAEVRTEFVDLSQLWRSAMPSLQWAEWEHDHDRDIGNALIGATGSTPRAWFSCFPLDMRPPAPEVGTLVFFRPTVHHAWTWPWQMDMESTQNFITRYFLTPREDDVVWKGAMHDRDAVFRYSTFRIRPHVGPWTRISFQRSILRSGRNLLLLHPIPSGTNFGDAATRKLPSLVAGILRLLRGAGYIGANHPTLALGRLGLSCYSAGGPAMFQALSANRHLVKEAYLFDPMFLDRSASAIIQWARATEDCRLHMTGAIAWASMNAIRDALTAKPGGGTAPSFLSTFPLSSAAWGPIDQGGNPWWNNSLTYVPAWRNDFTTRHQFVIFGGNQLQVDDSGRVVHYTTFMEDYLNASGF